MIDVARAGRSIASSASIPPRVLVMATDRRRLESVLSLVQRAGAAGVTAPCEALAAVVGWGADVLDALRPWQLPKLCIVAELDPQLINRASLAGVGVGCAGPEEQEVISTFVSRARMLAKDPFEAVLRRLPPTPREVFKLIADDATREQILATRTIRPSTLEKHMKPIYRVLGENSFDGVRAWISQARLEKLRASLA